MLSERLHRQDVGKSLTYIQRAFSAASFCYARIELFGSPSANCVIPLAALASLPPSITLRTSA